MSHLLFLLILFANGPLQRVFGQTCDEPYECDGYTFSAGSTVYCRGYFGCHDATFAGTAYCNGHSGCRDAKIDGAAAYCYGTNACRDAVEITTTGALLCKGYYGCYSAGSISGAGNVNCDGYRACNLIVGTITAGASLSCQGDNSCRESSLDAGVDVNCDGHFACYQTTIEAGDDVNCDGDHGCSQAAIHAIDNVICHGKYSCHRANITAHDYVYAQGFYGAHESIISAERVYGYGFRALSYATLDSTDELGMKVWCYGYEGGLYAQFICRAGSTCDLYCKSNCCQNMEFICLSGATCHSHCDGADCPMQRTSLSLGLPIPDVGGDNAIDGDKKLFKYLRDRDSTYIEIKQEISDDIEKWSKRFEEGENNFNRDPVKLNPHDFEPANFNDPDLITFTFNRRIMMNYVYGGMAAALVSVTVVLIAYYGFIKPKTKSAIYTKVILDDDESDES